MNRLAGILIGLIFMSFSGLPAQSDESRYIMVTGEGEMVADADQVSVSFAIETRNEDLDEAKRINDLKVEKVKEIFKLFSISNKDVDISSFWANPIYDFRGRQAVKVEAFNISRAVRITLRNISDFESLMDALIGAEIYNIGGLLYEISDPAALHKQARENALKKAREKAEGMALYYGLKLGKVVTIEEEEGVSHKYVDFGFSSSNILGNNVSKEGAAAFMGRKTIMARVTVKFELID